MISDDPHVTTEPFCPTEYITSTRRQAIDTLEQKEAPNLDGPEGLNHLISSVYALLQLNQEIMERIRVDQPDMGGFFNFHRTRLRRVIVKRYPEGIHCFFAEVETKTKTFGQPPSIPTSLAEMFSIAEEPAWPNLPDYRVLFQKIILLDESTMASFLGPFQEHLELVQAFLGGIEEWLSEPQKLLHYIEGLFHKKLVEPANIESEVHMLTQCGPYCSGSATLIYPPGQKKQRWRCGRCGDTVKSSRLKGQLQGFVLTKAEIRGDHKVCFDLDVEAERQSLRAFVTYATCNSLTPPDEQQDCTK